VRFPNVNDGELISAIEPFFQVCHRDLPAIVRYLFFLRLSPDSAELVIIDQFLDRRILSTQGALGIASQLEFLELHLERIE